MTSLGHCDVALQVLEGYMILIAEILFVVILLILVIKVVNLSRLSVDTYSKVVRTVSLIEEKVLRYEKSMFDYGVRLEVIEYQARRLPRSAEITGDKVPRLETKRDIIPDVTSRLQVITGNPNRIERVILMNMRSGSKTPREIQAVLGRSREHTARVLKRLYEMGFLSRTDEGKPYMYSLTERGQHFLES